MKRQKTVTRLVLILIPGIVGLLWLGTMIRQSDHPPVPDTPPDPVSREVVFRFTLRNTTNRPVSDSRFHVYVPVQQTDVQHCTGITASHPFELSTDAAGHQRLAFSFDPIAPYGMKQVPIRAQLSMRPTPWTDAPDDPGLFSAPDPALACGDQIRQLAVSLKRFPPPKTRPSASMAESTPICGIPGIHGKKKGPVMRLPAARGTARSLLRCLWPCPGQPVFRPGRQADFMQREVC